MVILTVEPEGSLFADSTASLILMPAPPGVLIRDAILVVLPLFSSIVVLTVTDCAFTEPRIVMNTSVKINAALLKKFNFLKADW